MKVKELQVHLVYGESEEELTYFNDNSFDSLITDPPAGISFLNRSWDSAKGGRDHWIAWLRGIMGECLRILKPGAHGLVWSIPRTSHWTAMALEDAGFEIRDIISHIFSQGFPKGQNISKGIDRRLQAKREVISEREASKPRYSPGWSGKVSESKPGSPEAAKWEGWHTGIKPAVEFWILVRKPYSPPNVIDNVLRHGVGGMNIGGCRILTGDHTGRSISQVSKDSPIALQASPMGAGSVTDDWQKGRFPANLVLTHHPACTLLGLKRVPSSGQNKGEALRSQSFGYHRERGEGASSISYAGQDGMEEVEDWECHPDCPIRLLDEQSGFSISVPRTPRKDGVLGHAGAITPFHRGCEYTEHFDSGGASRFFYCSKACPDEKLAYIPEQDRVVTFEEGIEHRRRLKEKHGERMYKESKEQAVIFHVTQKSLELMRWLVRLITPAGGRIIDPFAGTATTLRAALWEGFRAVGVDSYYPYHRIAQEVLEREARRIVESGERDQTFMDMI